MIPASPSPSSPRPSSRIAGTAAGAPPRRPHQPVGQLSVRSADLLEARGLDAELCTMLGIETASAPDGGDDWIAIPYVRHGAVVNRKYRRVAKRPDVLNFAQDKGGASCWWNHDALLDHSLDGQPLIVTEGELDAIAAMQAGFQRVVSVPGGAPSEPVKDAHGGAKYAFLADTLDLLRDVREIVLAVDGDGPGVVLLNDLAKRLGRGRCRYVTYPIGCKDLLDALRAGGPAAVVQCLAAARWMDVPGLHRMSELPPVVEAVPHVTGIAGLHEHYNLRLGDFCVLTGVPSSGKSTLVNDLACRMVERHGWNVCFASFEQHPQQDHRRALRTWFNRKPARSQSPGEVEAADDWIDRHFSFVVPPEDDDADLDWLLDMMASAVVRYDAKLVVIDPWNEMDHARARDETLTEYTGRAIRLLKKFARRWHVHLIVVAHPAKMARDRDGRVPMPTLYDISDSAHWYNKPDVGIVVHPKKDEAGSSYTEVNVMKSRYHDSIGKPGHVSLNYHPMTARFEAV